VLVILLDCNQTWIFPIGFRKNLLKYQTSVNLFLWERRFYIQTDGQTTITKLIVAFHYFTNVPKMPSNLCFVASQKLFLAYNKILKYHWSIISLTVMTHLCLRIYFILHNYKYNLLTHFTPYVSSWRQKTYLQSSNFVHYYVNHYVS
jgi:hypothetical protein